MIRTTLSVIFIVSAVGSWAQQQKKINTISFDTILHTGIDPAGELYIISSNKISKFDKNGNTLHTIEISCSKCITSFNTWNLTKIFIYNRSKQKIEILNHQLESSASIVIDSFFAFQPWHTAVSFDSHHLWILDAANTTLKKANLKTGETLVDVPADIRVPIEKTIRIYEYQRFLFIQTESQLLVFNATGIKIKSYPSTPNSTVGFFGEELFFLNQNHLLLVNIFTSHQRTFILPYAYNQVFFTDDRLLGITGNTVEIIDFRIEEK